MSKHRPNFSKAIGNFKTINSYYYSKIFTQFKTNIHPAEIHDEIADDVIPERWFYTITEVSLKLNNESVVFFLNKLILKLLASPEQKLFNVERLTDLKHFIATK